ncbi:DUF3551 domain-containing protein [Bradyrhizobium sp.]|uniref:DUF3551 domain-containing protein n=1 Tax=Bradyrhizobium sp. TaxID=376 RepID=UPI002C88F6C9|nr:DUF3551 domain-containing protein [Bradyrhizobium sp.]HMM91742.1 DUF3551 domain-containing protein [Bradyrhizobium sp.]
MRIFACTFPTIATVSLAAPARAQAYDPNFPVCLRVYGTGGGSLGCSFTSLALCAASASGLSAQCLTNPFFMHGGRNSPRQRRIY